MGSDLYDVDVLGVAGRRATFRMEVGHPDAGPVPANAAFALQVLHELTAGTDPLALEVSLEDTLNEPWLRRHARGFIADVRVETEHVPTRSGDDVGFVGARYVLTVEVTHVAWIAHCRPGTQSASRAFPMIEEFDAHPPIVPTHRLLPSSPSAGSPAVESLLSRVTSLLSRGAEAARREIVASGAEDPNAGAPQRENPEAGIPESTGDDPASFPLPREFLETLEPYPVPRGVLPRIIIAASHPASAFEPVEVREPYVDVHSLKRWHGRLVWWQARMHDGPDHAAVGPLYVEGRTARLCEIGDGLVGVRVYTDVFDGRIGLARLRSKARFGAPTSANRVLRGGLPHWVSARRSGKVAHIEIRLVPGCKLEKPLTLADALYLLLAPLLPDPLPFDHAFLPAPLVDAPITRSLRAIASAAGELPPLGKVIDAWNNELVERVEIVADETMVRDHDDLPDAAARKLYAAPWPRIHIRITAAREDSVQHLDLPHAERGLRIGWG